jgi:hypothetical protein
MSDTAAGKREIISCHLNNNGKCRAGSSLWTAAACLPSHRCSPQSNCSSALRPEVFAVPGKKKYSAGLSYWPRLCKEVRFKWQK